MKKILFVIGMVLMSIVCLGQKNFTSKNFVATAEDEFGEKTGEIIVGIRATGYFSNSATTNSCANLYLKFTKDDEWIELYEYCSNHVSDDRFNVAFIGEETGDTLRVSDYFYSSGSYSGMFTPRVKLLLLFKSNNTVKVKMYETKYGSTRAIFKLSDCKQFYKSYSSWFNDTKPFERYDTYVDSLSKIYKNTYKNLKLPNITYVVQDGDTALYSSVLKDYTKRCTMISYKIVNGIDTVEMELCERAINDLYKVIDTLNDELNELKLHEYKYNPERINELSMLVIKNEEIKRTKPVNSKKYNLACKTLDAVNAEIDSITLENVRRCAVNKLTRQKNEVFDSIKFYRNRQIAASEPHKIYIPVSIELNPLEISYMFKYNTIRYLSDSDFRERCKHNFREDCIRKVRHDAQQQTNTASKKYTVTKEETEETVYIRADKMPCFPGGMGDLVKFIDENLEYPLNDNIFSQLSGTVIVKFIVNGYGRAVKPEIIKSVNPLFDKAALDLVAKLPIFEPGEQNGKRVSVWYTLPVQFKIKNFNY